ncbi:hypothetical protein [Azospirillum sp. A1-3]|nr:hypothetical protein [Azospirillum sp. A1-3]
MDDVSQVGGLLDQIAEPFEAVSADGGRMAWQAKSGYTLRALV